MLNPESVGPVPFIILLRGLEHELTRIPGVPSGLEAFPGIAEGLASRTGSFHSQLVAFGFRCLAQSAYILMSHAISKGLLTRLQTIQAPIQHVVKPGHS